MKVLSDFDGVLTDLSAEAARVGEIFRAELLRMSGGDSALVGPILEAAHAEMDASPYLHGWRVNGRITAFCNEDGFIRVNALGACLDKKAQRRNSDVQPLRSHLVSHGIPNFTAIAQSAYTTMVSETARGELHPIDPTAVAALRSLMDRGVEVVVVSNSGTDRIVQLLRGAGLDPVAHGEGVEAPLRVRGDARKYHLGPETRCFTAGLYSVETNRPHYAGILEEERPDVIVGDVFSLDLALPLHRARTASAPSRLTMALRRREYTPAWSLDHLRGAAAGGVRCEVLDDLGSLVTLV